ncbi:MAG: hypothetical protein KAH32_07720 [Chlamydiia bacterium]|nr:hypothetical protein [Chlamydiia bacterium]
MGIINKTTQEINDILKFQEGIPAGDDAGVQFTEPTLKNVIIGNYDNPVELCVGQGDSTTDTMTTLHTVNGTSFIDVTEIFSSDSDSSTGLFGGTTANQVLYIGGHFQFSGVKAKIVTAGEGIHNNIIAEYYTASGWVKSTFMAVNSNFNPFSKDNQRADNLASISGISEQWYFNFDPYEINDNWIPSEINGETKYWSRIRIVSDIITDPVIEQIKLHTNRVEIENTGIFRYGVARYCKILSNGLSNTIKNVDQNPPNYSVPYTPTITAGYLDNQFKNGADDGFLFVQNVESGIDTSIPYALKVAYYSLGGLAGDIELQADVVLIGQDVGGSGPFVYDGTAPMTTYKNIDSVPISSALERRTTTFYIDISHLTPADAMVINIHRDASAGNPNDTLPHDVIMTHIVPVAYFWKD